MSQTVIEINCPGCGARVSTGQKECEWCHKPIIISTFNSVYSMPMPEVNKFAGAYRKALAENPDNQELNNSVAMCYLKLKLYDKALPAFEKAMEDNFDNSETFFYAAICLLQGKKAFLQQRPTIDKVLEYINAALMIEPTDFDSRVTVDVDFLLRKIPNTPEQLKVILEKIIAVDTGNDFVTFEIKDIAPIAVAKKYTGIGASIIARIKNTKTPFSIDFGVGDIIVPKQEKRKIPTQLSDFDAPMVNTYSIETTVAEKIDAILSLMEFSSRMKDYYDIYYLANKFDFDGTTLTEALKKTFENRNHNFTIEQFEQMLEFDSDDAMQKKWKAFIKKINTKTDDFETVLKTIKMFLREPFVVTAEKTDYAKHWSASNHEWI